MYEELNVTAVRQRIELSTLGAAEDGDIFYLADNPSAVYQRNDSVYSASYPAVYVFQRLGAEPWYRADDIGTGDARQRVVILHNTRKFAAVPETSGTDGC